MYMQVAQHENYGIAKYYEVILADHCNATFGYCNVVCLSLLSSVCDANVL